MRKYDSYYEGIADEEYGCGICGDIIFEGDEYVATYLDKVHMNIFHKDCFQKEICK